MSSALVIAKLLNGNPEAEVSGQPWTLAELVRERQMPQPVSEVTIGGDGVLLGFCGYIHDRYVEASGIPFQTAADSEKWLVRVGFSGEFPTILNIKNGAAMTIDDKNDWIDFPFMEPYFPVGSKLCFGG